MKEFKCYQWLVIDNQQLHYPYYIITPKHYVDKADVWKTWGPEQTECCFRPVRPLRESELVGEFAERIYGRERGV